MCVFDSEVGLADVSWVAPSDRRERFLALGASISTATIYAKISLPLVGYMLFGGIGWDGNG